MPTDGDSPRRAVLTHTITVPLSLPGAMALFTPAGERLWAEGWEPEFPAGEEGDGGERGTVFLTTGGYGTTYWAVAERTDDSVRYARVTPGTSAGFVEVRCHEQTGETSVEVTYDLTALGDDGVAFLDEFTRTYEHHIDHWQRRIEDALAH